MKSRFLFYLFGLFLLVFLGAFYLGEWFPGANSVKNLYNQYFLDKSSSIPPCDKLPSSENIKYVFEKNSAEVLKIEREKGVVNFAYDEVRCSGKAYVYLTYDDDGDIDSIKQFVGDEFYGFPVVFIYGGKN